MKNQNIVLELRHAIIKMESYKVSINNGIKMANWQNVSIMKTGRYKVSIKSGIEMVH